MADIYITGEIKTGLMKEVSEAINSDTRSINVYINTYGGCAITSFAVHDLLKEDERVNIVVQGAAYSGGAIIALAKGDFQMLPHSEFMFHKASRYFGWSNEVGADEKVRTLKHTDKAMRKLFKRILTPDELRKFDEGKDVYVTAKDLSKR